MKYWKTAAVMLLMGASVTLAGCGTTPTMMEEYSFGQVQLKAGNSEVYMDSPFDLAHVKRQDNDSMMYINKDDHVVIAVTSQALTSGNAQAMAEQDVAAKTDTPSYRSANEVVSDDSQWQTCCRRRLLLYSRCPRQRSAYCLAESLL